MLACLRHKRQGVKKRERERRAEDGQQSMQEQLIDRQLQQQRGRKEGKQQHVIPIELAYFTIL